MNRAIPWMRFSRWTGKPWAYLRALPSNLHFPSVLLIRRPRTKRPRNCSQSLKIFQILFLPCDTSLSSLSLHFFSPSHFFLFFYLCRFPFLTYHVLHLHIYVFYLHSQETKAMEGGKGAEEIIKEAKRATSHKSLKKPSHGCLTPLQVLIGNASFPVQVIRRDLVSDTSIDKNEFTLIHLRWITMCVI